VVEVLGLGQALGDQGLDGVGAAVEGEREFLPLGRGEVPEDEVGRVHAAGRTADSEPDPVVVAGAKGRGDRPQAIVAVVAAAQLQADPAEGDVELVVQNHGPFGRDLVKPEQRGNRAAGQVHVRVRPGQGRGLAGQAALRDVVAGAI
jgi:hypothetical protein